MFSHVSVRSRAAFVGAALLCPTAAFANGRYPAANLLAFDPVDRDHIVLAATFGLLESRDGAKTFRWSCESVLGVAGQQDLMIAITSAGATVAAKYDGVVRTSDGCTFESSPQLAGRNVGDLTLFRSAPNTVAAAGCHSVPLCRPIFCRSRSTQLRAMLRGSTSPADSARPTTTRRLFCGRAMGAKPSNVPRFQSLRSTTWRTSPRSIPRIRIVSTSVFGARAVRR